MVSKRCLFENYENLKWYQKPIFLKSSALGPSKNGHGEKQTWNNDEKTIGKSIFFDGPKPLKSILKLTLFLILGHSKKQWKNDVKGDLKSDFWGSTMATWASQFRLIIWFFTFWCEAKKSSFLDVFPMDQKIEQIEPWGAKGKKEHPE